MATAKTAKTDSKKGDAISDAAQVMADLMTQYQKMGMNAAAFMGGDWMERMSDMGAEMLQFYTQRVQEDVELYHKLLHSKNMAEMQDAQAEFLQRAIDRYTEETGKIIELSKAALSGGK